MVCSMFLKNHIWNDSPKLDNIHWNWKHRKNSISIPFRFLDLPFKFFHICRLCFSHENYTDQHFFKCTSIQIESWGVHIDKYCTRAWEMEEEEAWIFYVVLGRVPLIPLKNLYWLNIDWLFVLSAVQLFVVFCPNSDGYFVSQVV